jgi:hypothetical protein
MASKYNMSTIDYSKLSKFDFEAEMLHEKMCAEMNDIVGNYLCRTYRGWPWAVNADIRNGIVNCWINIGHGSQPPFGIQVKLSHHIQLLHRDLKKFGGELLERYGVRVGHMREKDLEDLMNRTDFAGRVNIDTSK